MNPLILIAAAGAAILLGGSSPKSKKGSGTKRKCFIFKTSDEFEAWTISSISKMKKKPMSEDELYMSLFSGVKSPAMLINYPPGKYEELMKMCSNSGLYPSVSFIAKPQDAPSTSSVMLLDLNNMDSKQYSWAEFESGKIKI